MYCPIKPVKMKVKYYLLLISTIYILAEHVEGLNLATPFATMQ